jgi:hypothetical protein
MFDTEAEAITRNEQEAIARGCAGDITDKWWGMREQDGKFYLVVGEDALQEGEEIVDVEFVPVPVSGGESP